MDSSIARLVEMFEERFGRRVTTWVIAVLVLAALVLAVNLIIDHLIMPTFQFLIVAIEYFKEHHVWKITQIIFDFIPVFAIVLGFVWSYYFAIKVRKTILSRAEGARKTLAEKEAILFNIEKEMEEKLEEIGAVFLKAQSTLAEAERTLYDVRRDRDAQLEYPPTLPHPSPTPPESQ